MDLAQTLPPVLIWKTCNINWKQRVFSFKVKVATWRQATLQACGVLFNSFTVKHVHSSLSIFIGLRARSCVG